MVDHVKASRLPVEYSATLGLMQQAAWQFWIDVGGTFTDCFARRPDGSLVRHKLLSSGVTKGERAAGSTPRRSSIRYAPRIPRGFWSGYRCVYWAGRRSGRRVDGHDRTRATELCRWRAHCPPPSPGQAYELARGEEAPVVAIRYFSGLPLTAEIPHVVVRLGTTRGTNALITRRGAGPPSSRRAGFGDILSIGYQNRPKLFDLAIKKRLPLFAEVVEIDERVTAEGEVLRAPDAADVRRQWRSCGEKVSTRWRFACCTLIAFASTRNWWHSSRAKRAFDEISVSSRVAPLVKIVARGDTTVMDAYLNPILRDYVGRLRRSLPAADLRIMTSAGGLVAAEQFVGKDSILSGPAGRRRRLFARGAGGRFHASHRLRHGRNEHRRLALRRPLRTGVRNRKGGRARRGADDGDRDRRRRRRFDLRLRRREARRRSAERGAEPGPACYGRGGPLAVTDVNFYLGKIPPEHFPFPLDRQAVEAATRRTHLRRSNAPPARRYTPVELCDGFLQVANANMVKAIQSISIAKGCDPAITCWSAFGGAGWAACLRRGCRTGYVASAVASRRRHPERLWHRRGGRRSACGARRLAAYSAEAC